MVIRTLSAVDIAIWDAIGKALNTPLYKLLGAAKTELPVVGYTYGEAEKTPEMVADEVAQQLAWGYAGTKLKVGRADMNEDVQRVHTIRQVVGDEAIIACDANRAWTPREAIRFARAVEGYNKVYSRVSPFQEIRTYAHLWFRYGPKPPTQPAACVSSAEIIGYSCCQFIFCPTSHKKKMDIPSKTAKSTASWGDSGPITVWRKAEAA